MTSSPAGIDCGTTCQYSFANGTSVTLTAAPAADSSFTGWSGACSGIATTCTVSMTAARSVTATFTLLQRQLAVVETGSGSGSVTSDPAGIDCGATCGTTLASGTTVTLTAVAATGSTFMGWSGACTGSAPTCTLSMTADRNVTATFTTNPKLTVLKAGTGSGAVSSNPAGIDCAISCAQQDATYTPWASVTLTATASGGSTFAGWSEASCGVMTTCTVSLEAGRSVTATFTADPPPPPVSPPAATADTPPAADAALATPRAVAPAAVKSRPTLRVRPKLSGRARAGKTIVCTRGTWNGSPSRYVFTWRRDGRLVLGHGSTYRVRTADGGHALRCDVTARNAKGTTTAATVGVRVPR